MHPLGHLGFGQRRALELVSRQLEVEILPARVAHHEPVHRVEHDLGLVAEPAEDLPLDVRVVCEVAEHADAQRLPCGSRCAG